MSNSHIPGYGSNGSRTESVRNFFPRTDGATAVPFQVGTRPLLLSGNNFTGTETAAVEITHDNVAWSPLRFNSVPVAISANNNAVVIPIPGTFRVVYTGATAFVRGMEFSVEMMPYLPMPGVTSSGGGGAGDTTSTTGVATAAPATLNNIATPTIHYGTNAAYLGQPVSWLQIGGGKVALY